MTQLRSGFLAVLGMIVLSTTAGSAFATTRYVASNGIDSGACGPQSSPCRSISKAITNAAAGDSIKVGPGFYGDLDGNGTLGGTGEEAGGCSGNCMIEVTKAVTIFSSDGAGATVIRAPSSLVYAVLLNSPNAALGKIGKGFTIAGPSSAQVIVVTSATASKLSGNRVIVGNLGFGLVLDQSSGAALERRACSGPHRVDSNRGEQLRRCRAG